MKETGQKLKEYTLSRGIKLVWIASKMNITPVALYYKVGGKSPFTMEDAVKIRNCCNMSAEEFGTIFRQEGWYSLIES